MSTRHELRTVDKLVRQIPHLTDQHLYAIKGGAVDDRLLGTGVPLPAVADVTDVCAVTEH